MPMVLLTGLGDNAHVYDNFAFQFTDHFRVIGITRRGFLPSSQPDDGYDVTTRAADDIAVLDALGIGKAVFVGHSLAGSELSRLGQDYPDRVDKLVYLDASDLSERFSPDRAEPPGMQPLFTPDTLKSLEAYQAASARYSAVREPDPAACHNLVFSATGAIVDATYPDWVSEKLLAGVGAMPPTDWTKVTAPRLGIFAPFTAEARQACTSTSTLRSRPLSTLLGRRSLNGSRRRSTSSPRETRRTPTGFGVRPTTSTSTTKLRWSGGCGSSWGGCKRMAVSVVCVGHAASRRRHASALAAGGVPIRRATSQAA